MSSSGRALPALALLLLATACAPTYTGSARAPAGPPPLDDNGRCDDPRFLQNNGGRAAPGTDEADCQLHGGGIDERYEGFRGPLARNGRCDDPDFANSTRQGERGTDLYDCSRYGAGLTAEAVARLPRPPANYDPRTGQAYPTQPSYTPPVYGPAPSRPYYPPPVYGPPPPAYYPPYDSGYWSRDYYEGERRRYNRKYNFNGRCDDPRYETSHGGNAEEGTDEFDCLLYGNGLKGRYVGKEGDLARNGVCDDPRFAVTTGRARAYRDDFDCSRYGQGLKNFYPRGKTPPPVVVTNPAPPQPPAVQPPTVQPPPAPPQPGERPRLFDRVFDPVEGREPAGERQRDRRRREAEGVPQTHPRFPGSAPAEAPVIVPTEPPPAQSAPVEAAPPADPGPAIEAERARAEMERQQREQMQEQQRQAQEEARREAQERQRLRAEQAAQEYERQRAQAEQAAREHEALQERQQRELAARQAEADAARAAARAQAEAERAAREQARQEQEEARRSQRQENPDAQKVEP